MRGAVQVIFLLLACVFLLLISACQNSEGEEEPQAISDAGEESAAVEPEATPETEPEQSDVDMAMQEDDYCLDCHTDKDRLIDTASHEEEVVEESSGEG